MAKNQIKKGVVLSYVLIILNMLVALIYTPVMINLLGKSEYGLYTLVGSVVSYLSLFSLGFNGAYLRFYARYKSRNDEKGVARLNGMFLTLFLAMALLALVSGLLLSRHTPQIFGDKLTVAELNKATVLMRILVINIASTFPCSIFDSILSSQEQFIFQRILAILGVVVNPLICLPLLISGYGSVAMVVVTTCITFGKLFVSMWYCKYKLSVKFIFEDFNKSLLREISSFSFFIFLNMIIDQVNWSVDKLIIGRIIGTSAVAIYGVGAMINSMYITFSTAVSSVFSPKINMIANTKNKENKFTELFIKVGRVQLIVLGLILTGFIFFGEYFITDIYTSAEYRDAYYVALFLIVPITVPLIQNLGLEIQRSVNKHKFRSLIYFFMAIANIFISIPLCKHYGPIGASIGTAISLVVANGIIMNIYYKHVIGIDIPAFWKSILCLCKGMIIPIVLGIVIIKYVEYSNNWMYLGYIILYTFIYILSMYYLGMNAYEKGLTKSVLRKAHLSKS